VALVLVGVSCTSDQGCKPISYRPILIVRTLRESSSPDETLEGCVDSVCVKLVGPLPTDLPPDGNAVYATFRALRVGEKVKVTVRGNIAPTSSRSTSVVPKAVGSGAACERRVVADVSINAVNGELEPS
jgi:hypothetical protein